MTSEELGGRAENEAGDPGETGPLRAAPRPGETASPSETGPAPAAPRPGETASSSERRPGVGAPDLLADEEERRKRDRLRAALFGGGGEPEAIGRFRLLRRLGAGGMGVVYAARDEQLGRDVAVKLLRSRGGGVEERDRLLREAQAMAKLSHPNVVTVYEVGFHGDRLFVAMEMVRGETVAAWLRGAPRSAPEVLDVLSKAGRGLAAAHAAGLVHRDFKPENVMIGEGGEVKVLDFGLARQADEPREGESAPGEGESGAPESGRAGEGESGPPKSAPAGEGESGAPESGRAGEGESGAPKSEAPPSALAKRLTRTGALLGTPAYMAPEQFAGEATDARTDQYAFCVSLYEALYGERPFPGGTLDEIAEASLAGEVRDASPGSKVPVWLRRVVVRGLARDRRDRWPSMEELLAALADDPAIVRRRRARWGAALVATGAVIAVTAWLSRGSAPRVCEGSRAEIERAWNDAARSGVRAGLAKTKAPYAADAAERVIRVLDRYTDGWAAMHREACLSNARGEQSSELLDLRMACLARREAEVAALAGALSEGAEGTAARAVPAAESLSSLSPCADAEALRAQVKPPSDPSVLAAVKAVRASLVDVEADNRIGQYTRGLDRSKAALAEAEKTAYRPVIAEAAYDVGVAHVSLDRYDDAAKAMERAYYEALAAGDDTTAAHASRQLYTLLGYHQSKREAGAPWERSAEALAARLSGSPVLRADFLNTRGLVRAEAGELDGAAADYGEALTVYERELGPSHLKVAMLLSNMAQVAYLRGRHADSAAQLERAMAIREAALGPDHPELIATLTNLSLVRVAQGDTKAAIDLLRRALASMEKTVGQGHSTTAFVIGNLAYAYSAEARYEEALALYRKALGILESDPAASRARLARSRQSVANMLIHLGREDEAAPLVEKALSVRREVLPKDHVETAGTLLALAKVRVAQAKPDEAAALARDAAAMVDRLADADPSDKAEVLTGLGEVLLAKKDGDGATAALRKALALRLEEKGTSAPRAETRFALAKALVLSGREGDRPEAAKLASEALAEFRASAPGWAKRASEVEAWASASGVEIGHK